LKEIQQTETENRKWMHKADTISWLKWKTTN